MNEPEHVFTAPITVVNPSALPQRRKRLDVWPAFFIAVLTVSTICSGSYALALLGEVHHQQSEIKLLQTQVSTLRMHIVHSK